MDAQQYLQTAEAAGRVKWLAKFDGKELLGRAGALILDEHECIAVLLEDGTRSADPQLRPGQVVKYTHSSQHGGLVIVGSANLRGDKPDEPVAATPVPAATPSTPPAGELEVARKAAAGAPKES
jgi:hypothetical protein